MTPKSGQDSLARTAWKRLRFFIVLGVVLALHLPSFADSILRFMDRLTPVVLDEPAARIEAQALAKECRDGCSWEGKTVIVDGRAVKVSFDGWPMFVEFEGGLICRMSGDAADEAAAVEKWNAASVVGIVKTEREKVFLDGCRAYRDEGTAGVDVTPEEDGKPAGQAVPQNGKEE